MWGELFGALKEANAEARGNEPIFGMATLRKADTGLPVNIYVDDSLDYVGGGHGKRIKFQPDRGNRPLTRTFVTMTIADEPRVIGGHELSSKEIQQIKGFVLRNRAALERLADMDIGIADFLRNMR